MDPQPKRSSWSPSTDNTKGILVTVLIVVLGGLLFAALANWVTRSLLPGTRLVQALAESRGILTAWDILAIPVLIMFVLGTHEIGHLLGGLSQRMKFVLLIVGPFGWHASAAGIRFQWNTHVAFMGGLAAASPTETGASLRRQLLVLIAGGPVASLLLAILAVPLAAVSDPRFAAYFIWIAAMSFGIFFVTLIPTRAGGFMSDGMQLIDVLRGGSAAIEKSALLQVFAQSMEGVRPRDWSASAIDALSRIESEKSPQQSGGSLYLLARAMDCQHQDDIARYRKRLEEGVDAQPSAFKQTIHIELAICAWLTGDAAALRRHLEAGKGGIVEESRRLLAQAALAKLEGRHEDCERDRLLALKAQAKTSDAGQGKLTEDQLAMLQGTS
jgi:hypothetical protein